MKTITFRPLRRIKKTGKIAVASYMQWYKVKCADCSKFTLIINEEYKTLPKDELVYNHNGENLFWRHYNPEEIPLITGYELTDGERSLYPKMWKTDYDTFCAKGLDCCGTPTFSHGTADNLTIGNMYNYTLEEVVETINPMKEFEPLTVEIVNYWFGWFLYRLRNCELVFQKVARQKLR